MSPNVTSQRPVSVPTFTPAQPARAAVPESKQPVALAFSDAFLASPARSPVALGGSVKSASIAQSAPVESLFGARSAALSLPSGAGALPVPQMELEVGSSGPEVAKLQQCLVALGYLSQETVNTNPGFFGENTTAAMQAFQAAHGLEQVGRFGPGSRAAMEAASARLPTIDRVIDESYRNLLGRAPDAGGKTGWRRGLEERAAAGGSEADLRAMIEGGIKASDEYRNRSDRRTPTQVVNELYTQVMERPGDPGGVASFVNRYNQLASSGMGKGDIENTLRNEMKASPEYNVKETVKGLYRQLLNRDADPAGRKSWTDTGMRRLAQGADLNTVRNEISNAIMQSPEYRELHKNDQVPGADAAINFALNPGRNNMAADGNWHFWCLGLVNKSFQAAGRNIPELQAGTAKQSYFNYLNQGRIRTDGIPPKGAVVFYDSFQEFGHIGISTGDGRIVNTFESGNPQTGYRGLHDLPNYLGWALP
ncbi:MAG TPA: DUF4214 domain-containing protein [Myxococcaceae bacterium]|nr:DUF4214 domain-containing protein [Myxococcaceae bacterium]